MKHILMTVCKIVLQAAATAACMYVYVCTVYTRPTLPFFSISRRHHHHARVAGDVFELQSGNKRWRDVRYTMKSVVFKKPLMIKKTAPFFSFH